VTLHHGISREAYVSLPGINWSALRQGYGKTGMHIQTALENKDREDTRGMKFGRALHMAILQPEFFATSWEVKPKVKTTVEDGMLSEAEAAHITAMVAKFQDLKLNLEHTELALTWQRDGYDCKGSIDAVTTDGILIDLKTTDDASPAAMAATVWRMGYHGQLAWYKHGLTANGVTIKACWLVCMEKAPPYGIGCYILCPYALQRGDTMATKLLNLYRDRTVADYVLQNLPVPNWAITDDALLTQGN
jgi:exodeoxyribonuclease VIII